MSNNLSRRVAVIGSGISGLGSAWELTQRGYAVSVFESQSRLGGHAHTVDVTIDGQRFGVDTGFLVFNHKTYPNLIRLFADLGVATSVSEMSFSVSEGPHRFEWAGSNLATVFAQKRNLVSPSFWRMLSDIVRFNRQATQLAAAGNENDPQLTGSLRTFLARHRYSDSFKDRYLLPMAAAIWSCPIRQMLEFPLLGFIRFLHNHGLLQISNRPQWYTVSGGSRHYVEKIASQLRDVRLNTPVLSVSRHKLRSAGKLELTSAQGTEAFDHVVLACHSDQALRLLADPSPFEQRMLQGVRYQPNSAWLHTDIALMPKRRSAWAAWNYLSSGRSSGNVDDRLVSVTYWLNRLQPLPVSTPLLVSLNPLQRPAADQTLLQLAYEHPVFDQSAAAAVALLPQLQGQQNTWYAGAWLGYGFHEDGLKSGLQAVAGLIAQDQSANALPWAA